MIMLYPKNNQELILKNSSPTFRMSKWENPQTKKWKMMKIDIVIKFDVKVVAHSEVVQNTSTTPKLSIPDHITSLKSELPPNNAYWKTVFFQFSVILRDTISYLEQFLRRTHTWKFFQYILWIMEMIFAPSPDIFWRLDQKLLYVILKVTLF